MKPLLQLEQVHAGYGPVEVLKGLDLVVNDGEIVTVLADKIGSDSSTLRSNAMPASYALEALQQVSSHPDLTAVAVRDMVVVLAFAVVAMALAAATLRRRTP